MSFTARKGIFVGRGGDRRRLASPFATPGTKGTRTKAKAQPRPAPRPVDDLLPHIGPRIVCAWPPVACSPNHRNHWDTVRAKKAYRRECWALALAAKVAVPADGPIRIHLDFFPPDRRARDDDNAEASFKAGRDGIAEALRADDSRFVVSRSFHDEPRACVVITIIEGESEHA